MIRSDGDQFINDSKEKQSVSVFALSIRSILTLRLVRPPPSSTSCLQRSLVDALPVAAGTFRSRRVSPETRPASKLKLIPPPICRKAEDDVKREQRSEVSRRPAGSDGAGRSQCSSAPAIPQGSEVKCTAGKRLVRRGESARQREGGRSQMDHVTTRSGFTLSFIPCDDQRGGADGRCHGYGEALLAE